jgi:hypothetical protein
MLLGALAFVIRYGRNVPFWDEWGLFADGILTGDQPLTITWLWRQHNEHRIPLPKLIILSLLGLTGYDFRAGMFVNVAILAALAFALVRAARRLRGWTSYTDAFFPMALLHVGHAECFLWSWQVQFTVTTALAGLLLITIVRSGEGAALNTGAVAGLCLLLLPLGGANGLALVPALALWLIYLAAVQWRCPKPHAKRNAVLMLFFALASLLLVGLSFIGLERSPGPAYSPGLTTTLESALQFLTGSFGAAAGLYRTLMMAAMVGLLLLTAGTLFANVYCNQYEKRPQVLGLLLFLAAFTCLALGFGWGRPGAGLSMRYSILAVPVLCCIYLTWEVCNPLDIGSFIQVCLFTLMSFMTSSNIQSGISWGSPHCKGMEAFEQELRKGVPPSILAEHHVSFLCPWCSKEDLAPPLRWLRDERVGQFRLMPEDPSFREVALPVTPANVRQTVWQDSVGYGAGSGSYLTFALDRPQLVYAVRLRYSYPKGATASFRLSWG